MPTTTSLTKEFCIYDMHNSEGWAWTIVQTEQEIPEERLEAFRDSVMTKYGWVPERFRIYRYVDEEKFQKEIAHWKKPESPFISIDISGTIRSNFDEAEGVFEGIQWRTVLSKTSI